MLDRIRRRLLLAYTLTFVGVLSVFSLVVYAYFEQSLDSQIRENLATAVNVATGSIDTDDVDEEGHGLPDAIENSYLADSPESRVGVLQWFDAKGVLKGQHGSSVAVTTPFFAGSQFSEQPLPHALILTRPVSVKGRLLGYMRGVHPLDKRDSAIGRLVVGLACGIVCGAALSAIGIHIMLGQAMRPIIDSVLRLRQFTADASHELLSPVTAIKSNADVALKYSDGMRGSDLEKFRAITDGASQMQSLIDSLMQMARVDESGRDGSGATANYCDAAEVIEKLTRSYAASHQAIELVLALEKPLPVRGSQGDLNSLIGNVISNAFQYTHDGGKVVVSAKSDSHNVRVVVMDTGMGIDAAHLQNIFDRFWRADRARTARAGGAGLGLSIARGLAEKYGGSIEVASELGKGTTFEITLPVFSPPASKASAQQDLGTA